MADLAGNDPDVGFLVRTMLTRDPKKRQVKPVQHHMLTLDFPGLEDSEDDDDYELPKGRDSDDASSSGMDTDEESSGGDSEGSDEDEEGDEEEESGTAGVDLSQSMDIQDQNTETVLGTESLVNPKQIKVLICGVCLQDYSGDSDEIVECDGCGVAVHEGCYGMTESMSVASTVSSASTEPWFCEPCKAGVTHPYCELCPNLGGIFKETDAGKWCHLLCALYVPGVAFGDIDLLTPVTLFEMPYSRWGAKDCILCEDSRFSRTGVCIGCDAGLCRNYFHVTCAQREGLLSEASPDEEIADPFYAHCKQHAEKLMMAIKRRNYMATQSRLKMRREEEGEYSEKEKSRIKRKLERNRRKFNEAKVSRPPCWIPTEKMPRMLTSSASALCKLTRKAELLGISNSTQPVTTQTDVRKKWHLAPAFNVDFISYFLDRDGRIVRMRSQQKDLSSARDKLKIQEKTLRDKYEKMSSSMSTLRDKHARLYDDCTQLWTYINKISTKNHKLPSLLKPKKPEVVTETKQIRQSSPTPHVIHKCSVCDSKEDQHLLVKCDQCLQFYHLACLDPPLTRMPKKTKLYGWQCSECIETSSDDSDVSVDTSAPMRLRETIKEPQKFSTIQTNEIKMADKKKKKKKKKNKSQMVKVETSPSEPVTKEPKKSTPPAKKSPVKVKKESDVRRECDECGRPGDNSTLVRCDECRRCYHFHCLDPPMKHTPKQAGYGWICTQCTSSLSESDVEAEECEVQGVRTSGRADDVVLVLGVESEEMEDMQID